jgi:hypothetical protein
MTAEERRRIFEAQNPRIDELPPGVPEEGDYIPYWSKRDGVTKRLSAAMFTGGPPAQIDFTWIPNRVDEEGNPLPYNLNDPVIYGGEWYISLIDNNTFTPGVGDQWLKQSTSFSGGFWKAGVYNGDQPWVFSNHSGETQIYELIDPTRPFISTDIVAEEAAGKWRTLSSKVNIDLIDTSDAVIELDLKHSAQRWFKGVDNIDGPRLWNPTNVDRLVEAKFFFTMSGLFAQELPQNFRMSDPLFNPSTRRWVPFDVGDYEATINYDGAGNYNVKIYGPFGGGGNQMPTILMNEISYTGGLLQGPRQYFDPEGDLENNPKPQVLTPTLVGTPEPGEILTATWTFHSPSGYAQGTHRYQWYRSNEDGSSKEAIVGATNSTYLLDDDDVDRAISCVIIAVQTAPAPANGNPESDPVETAGLLVEAPSNLPAELDLDLHYDHVMDLKSGNYDAVNFRVPDTGLVNAGATFWTSPDAGKRPTYDGANKRLVFDPAVEPQFIEAVIQASNAKGTSNTRRYEFIGVIEFDVIPSDVTIFSILTSLYFELEGGNPNLLQSAPCLFTGFTAQTGVKYRFRLRTDIVGGVVEARLQLNYDESNGTYLFDGVDSNTNGGAGIGAGNTFRIGASKNVPALRGLDGKVYGMALLGQAHVDQQYELNLWRTLNATAGI